MGTLFLGAVILAALYVASLKIWPFTSCGWCSGGGRNAGSNRKRWGNCRHCGGTGRRLRFGARMLARKD